MGYYSYYYDKVYRKLGKRSQDTDISDSEYYCMSLTQAIFCITGLKPSKHCITKLAISLNYISKIQYKIGSCNKP